MKKLSNKILIAILLVLAGAFLLSRLFRAPALESNLRRELVKLDTSKVSEIRILPSSHHDEEIRLLRDGYRWKAVMGKREAETDRGVVASTLGMLLQVQPQRMVSRKKDKWEEFNVGEKGTHVAVYENSTKMGDFVVGKTGFAQASGGGFGGGFTYFRLSDENEVYVIDGFFESGFNRAFNEWRNKAFLRFKIGEIDKITYQYPADSGFVAEKKDSVWYIAQAPVNVAAMESYLEQLALRNMNEFADEFVNPGPPQAIIDISGKPGAAQRVEGWKQGEKWILTSSWQKGIYFSSPETVAKTVLIGKKKLLPPQKK